MERGEAASANTGGVLDRPEPGLRQLLAPNPSPMTNRGTNTFIIGEGEVVVIDPGPAIDTHLEAILAALDPGERVGAILVTHSHLDHSPLARPLAAQMGAEIFAAGPSDWGQSATMRALAASGQLGGGEGVDAGFSPDRQIADGQSLTGPWGEIDVIATPGHMANHLSFAWQGALFSGDMVMAWSTSLVSPPDGDMGAFMASLARLQQRGDRIYYPGHGDPVRDPQHRLQELVDHRRGREAEILAALSRLGPSSAGQVAAAVYTDVAPALLPAAERNVLAHLIDLNERSLASSDGPIAADARFAAA